MKQFFSALILLAFLIGSVAPSVAGRKYYHSPHYGYSHGYKYHHKSYRYHKGYRYHNGYKHHHDHYDDALVGLAVGVVLGGVLASAFATPPPPRTVYAPPPAPVYQPRICFQNRRVSGEWQQGSYGGQSVWVNFAYPLMRRVQVPCN